MSTQVLWLLHSLPHSQSQAIGSQFCALNRILNSLPLCPYAIIADNDSQPLLRA